MCVCVCVCLNLPLSVVCVPHLIKAIHQVDRLARCALGNSIKICHGLCIKTIESIHVGVVSRRVAFPYRPDGLDWLLASALESQHSTLSLYLSLALCVSSPLPLHVQDTPQLCFRHCLTHCQRGMEQEQGQGQCGGHGGSTWLLLEISRCEYFNVQHRLRRGIVCANVTW